jgi:GTPase SAR1 family protein
LNTIYQSYAQLNTQFDFSSKGIVYKFDGKALQDALRGNQEWENILQHKRVGDEFVLMMTRSALKRTEKIIAQLQEVH